MAEAAPSDADGGLQLIKEGDYAVFDENGEKYSVLMVKAAATFKAGKGQVSMEAIIGHPFGTMFQVSADGRRLEKLQKPPSELGAQVSETQRNNSKLNDQNETNQKMTHEEIMALRESAKSGEEIVAALCSSSATFETKTEFAQEKYKKRKAKKYCVTVTVRRPSARALCDTFFEKSPIKTWAMRSDTLAIMLNLANVGAGGKTLVVEQCQGLMAAAVAERQGGHGHICCASVDGKAPSTDTVRFLNQSAAERSIISTAMLAELQEAAAAVQQQQAEAAAAVQQQQAEAAAAAAAAKAAAEAAARPPAVEQAAQAAAAEDVEMPDAGDAPAADAAAAADADADADAAAADPSKEAAVGAAEAQQQQAEPGQPAQQAPKRAGGAPRSSATPELLQQLLQPGFASCIVAAPRLHPVALLKALLPLLAPSASFAVYSPYLQPLAEAQHALSSAKMAVQLRVQESWFREHQVLPGRTHPTMVMTGTGGYILSGTKISSTLARPRGGEQAGGQKRPGQEQGGQGKRQRT